MDRKSIALLLATIGLTNISFAGNIIGGLMPMAGSSFPATTQSHKAIKHSTHHFTDFSGTWIQKCDIANDEHTVVIENDANYITINNESQTKIGKGLQGRYESGDEYSVYAHASYEWGNNAELIMKASSAYKDNQDNSAMYTNLLTYTLTMNNGHIDLDGKMMSFKDLTQTYDQNIHCTFTKKV